MKRLLDDLFVLDETNRPKVKKTDRYSKKNKKIIPIRAQSSPLREISGYKLSIIRPMIKGITSGTSRLTKLPIALPSIN